MYLVCRCHLTAMHIQDRNDEGLVKHKLQATKPGAFYGKGNISGAMNHEPYRQLSPIIIRGDPVEPKAA